MTSDKTDQELEELRKKRDKLKEKLEKEFGLPTDKGAEA